MLDALKNTDPLQGPPWETTRGGPFLLYNRYKARPPGAYWCRRGFPRKKLPPDCAFCTENIPGDETEQIKKKICVFSKKHLPNARRCDRISLGCKRLVRYKSCRPAICVDAGGCHPAIAEMGYFRGVCPILEPGERITETKGYVRHCILRCGPMFTLLCDDSFRENCANTVHRILSCEKVEHPETCVIYRLA